MHNRLPAHVQISWDVLLTDDGPVYLEGNVFPPGCDYKLTVFKDWENFTFLKDRLIESNGVADDPTRASAIEPVLEAAERVHGALVEAPLDLLEGMGVAEARTAECAGPVAGCSGPSTAGSRSWPDPSAAEWPRRVRRCGRSHRRG